jgi:hypothetical protein
MSIEDRRYDLLGRMGSLADTIYVSMDRTRNLGRGNATAREFAMKVKDDARSVAMWKGIAYPTGQDYVKKIPGPPRSSVEISRLMETIRMNMYSLIQYYLFSNDLKNAHLCSMFLTEFDKSHYNHFVLDGQISMLINDRERALTSLREALDICERDKQWPRESMDKIKEAIRGMIESIQTAKT